MKYSKKYFSISGYGDDCTAKRSAIDFLSKIDDDDVLDISVKEYLKLPTNTKRLLYTYKCPLINWPEKKLLLDPYILGTWLGDGGTATPTIATVDTEVLEYWKEWARKYESNIVKISDCAYRLRNNVRSRNYNPLSRMLSKYNVYRKKRIPIEYLTSDKDTRLKLFAGLVDTDGNVTHSNRMIRFSQGPANFELFDDVVYLAKSLGFKVCTRDMNTTYTYKGELKHSIAKNMTISGNTELIPTLIPRKKCKSHIEGNCSINIDRLRSKFKVEKMGIDKYYGFNIGGNHRFLLGDFTVTHNCMDLMRSGDISGEGAHVLYGMDADLIMLSLIAPVNKISLMREDIRDVIDIDTLKYALAQELKLPTAVRDFVVMVFTIGNDFLPHMPALEALDEALATLIKVYTETGVSLTTDTDLDWTGLSQYLINLAQEEPRLLKAEAVRNVKYPSRMIKAASKRTERIEEGDTMMIGKKISFKTEFSYDIFRGAWYQNSLTPRGPEFPIAKMMLPGYNFGVTMDKMIDMCHQYLTGMAWVYNYYTKGTIAINSEFVYKYHHTPLLSDLSSVLNQVGKIEGYLARDGQIVLNPIHQLLSVLPLQSKNLLPKEVTHLMTKDSPIADLYPATAVIERDGKNAEWQGVVLIPFVEPSRVITAVNSTTRFAPDRAKLYSQGSNVVIIRDPEMSELDAQKKGFRQF
jgi:intein/homing endonuclease